MISKNIALPNRVRPKGLECGRPNLIKCEKSNIWRTILSIYMLNPNENLPSAAEVLICNESTSSEEIELLLRRAMQKPSDKGLHIRLTE